MNLCGCFLVLLISLLCIDAKVLRLPSLRTRKSIILRTADADNNQHTRKHGKASDQVTLSALEQSLCGALATSIGDLVMHPVDTVKVYQQSEGVGTSLAAATMHIFRKGGLSSFYAGVVPYCVSDGLSGAIKFGAFEVCKAYGEETMPTQYHPTVRFVAAAFAMFACSIILVPGEVIKTRLQSGKVSHRIKQIDDSSHYISVLVDNRSDCLYVQRSRHTGFLCGLYGNDASRHSLYYV